MSLFRKPKKQIQRRVFTDNSDEEEPMEVDCPSAPVIKNESKKDKKNKKPKQNILSFETEEEGEVFQVKKSSHHKKIMRMFEKEKHKKKEPKPEKETKNKEKTEIVTDDLVLVVNPSHKKPATPPPPILSGRDALCAGKDDLSSEEEDENLGHGVHRFSRPDNFKKVLESGAIPDAAMIHAARKRRQWAREMGDTIPLEEEKETDDGGSRLQREDEHEGSDDERIDMDLNHKARDLEKRREQFYAAQESDQEIDEWEDQQIRKGVTGAAAALAQELISEQVQQQTPIIHAPVIEPGIPRTPQMIVDKLKEHFQDVSVSREKHAEQLEKVQQDIIDMSEELEALRVKAPEAADRFRFYQELRGYITDLVECLDEKVGTIMTLEQKAMDLLAKKSDWFIERRRQDVRDQAEEVTSKVNTKKVPDNEVKMRRAAEREGRRTRRRRARELADQGTKHVEGMSSDEEISQQEAMNFDKEQDQIENEAKEVFEDVIEDYSTIANILIRFEQWRENDITVYNEAYATLCLPKVVSPLIRLNLIFWNPLKENQDLEKLPWYRTLALYGLHDDETESTLSKDPDINLLPVLVEKLIVPKLAQLVDRCWDPLSSSQTLRLLSIITRYIRRFPTLGPGSKSLNNLFNAILHKMKTSLEHDVFIPMTPRLADSKSCFFQRQFASGMKLLKNITSWQGVLNDNTLKELALTSLLNRYLLTSIKFCMLTDAVAKVNLITQILPRIWLQNNTAELKMFITTVMSLLQQLDKNCPLHLESIEILNGILKTLRN
ncbi:hypothetical protein HHI36_004431 [Cryptolaemus montrouzieri]|uniref:GCF C-terminal domain-containing protein n=1 Tax=Cryptolaemus montrouzieri TaxID=559131 RepID=A0ABD2NRZ2_9CUCU